eukprot:4118067-Pyramimonas_sp.AAC.1
MPIASSGVVATPDFTNHPTASAPTKTRSYVLKVLDRSAIGSSLDMLCASRTISRSDSSLPLKRLLTVSSSIARMRTYLLYQTKLPDLGARGLCFTTE